MKAIRGRRKGGKNATGGKIHVHGIRELSILPSEPEYRGVERTGRTRSDECDYTLIQLIRKSLKSELSVFVADPNYFLRSEMHIITNWDAGKLGDKNVLNESAAGNTTQ